MKIQVISDIHLEFGIREFDFPKADLLILAGDVSIGMAGFTWISERVKNIPLLYVLGNHEYYKNSSPLQSSMHKAFRIRLTKLEFKTVNRFVNLRVGYF